MRSAKYIFDAASGVFRRSVVTAGDVILTVVKYLLAASALAVLWYAVLALVLSTDTEKKLKASNRAFEQNWTQMRSDAALLSAEVTGLEIRDADIYSDIFHGDIPENASYEELLSEDDVTDADVARITSEKLSSALDGAAGVDANFRRIFAILLADGQPVPPLSAPLEKFDAAAAGASVGVKTSPFLQMEVTHTGLDMIAPAGSGVIAAADGQVSEVSRSGKGEGNVVAITHEGGYVTRYAHLGSISVKRGERVKRGQKIGTIGLSGASYAPHLHYEVHRDSLLCDPVDHLAASLDPVEYYRLRVTSAATGQSLD